MGKTYAEINNELATWIRNQRVFFVATAPLARKGQVNCSPKGGDSFRILDSLTIAYQDLTGSGAETIAHLRENERIVIMFCAFEGPPKIIRLHGSGEVILKTHPEFESLGAQFPENPGRRAFIRVRITRISDSCGYAVPLMEYQKDRDTLEQWAEALGPAQLDEYRKDNNQASIDGLPAIDIP